MKRLKKRQVPSTGLAIAPMKVKRRDSTKTIQTYAFLDTGSHTSFCTNELLGKLGITDERTILSLTTIQNENSPTDCRAVSLDVLDLDENNFVELLTVFSTEKLPVDESSIPRQADVDRWSHLNKCYDKQNRRTHRYPYWKRRTESIRT